MSQTFKILLAIVLVLIGWYYFQLPAYKNKVVLADSPTVVEANMKTMLALCQKLNWRNGVSIYVTNTPDSTLIINGERYGSFPQAASYRLEGNKVLRNLSNPEIDQLLSTYAVLNRNYIHAVTYNIERKEWMFSYGYDVRYNEFEHQRYLFLVNDPSRLSSPLFTKYYTVVDHKGNLVLVSLKDVRQ